jgi:hypothetical protein
MRSRSGFFRVSCAAAIVVAASAAVRAQDGPKRPPRPGAPPPARPGDEPANSPAPSPAPSPSPTPSPSGRAPRPGAPVPVEPSPSPAPVASPSPAPSPTPAPAAAPSPSPAPARVPTDRERGFLPVEDRWRVEFPEWRRSGADASSDAAVYRPGASTLGSPLAELLDPYSRNILKGDYPILGDDIFFTFEGKSDTLVEGRSFPLASGVSTQRPQSERFFGTPDQLFFVQDFVTSFELFRGDTAFKPKDWAIRLTPVYQINYLDVFERNVVNIDPREGSDRVDGHVGIQEGFVEYHLADLSASYDFLTVIAGIQPFTSDFRGFLYSDNDLGVRLQGNYLSNSIQANLAWFHQLEKDTNSGLNGYTDRGQEVFIANVYFQDLLGKLSDGFLGYTIELSYHANWDHSGVQYDTNGFLVRPENVGAVTQRTGYPETKSLYVHYLGVGGDGHLGPINVTNQFYLAFGHESQDEITGRPQEILADFAAVEASVDIDWLRIKSSFLFASGDANPASGKATGFDTIFDNPFFAGAGFAYWTRQNIPLVGTGIGLKNRQSLLPDLRSSKTQGMANFVNPGLLLYNVGVSAKLTPELFLSFDASWLEFDKTEVLKRVLQRARISTSIGTDLSLGVQWRPLLTENVILTGGVATLIPGGGFAAIYQDKAFYSGFTSFTFTF